MSDAERIFLQRVQCRVGLAAAAALTLGILGWLLLDRDWLRGTLELTHGWLLLALAFMALCGGLRCAACQVPMLGPVGLGACALAWAALLLPLAVQGAAAALGPFGVLGLLAGLVLSMEAEASAVAAHQRSPSAAALELLAGAGLLPWRGVCLAARCFRAG